MVRVNIHIDADGLVRDDGETVAVSRAHVRVRVLAHPEHNRPVADARR